MSYKIQIRRDNASNWSLKNPVLSIGEMGLEIDSHQFKLGDGVTNWNSLAFYSGVDVATTGSVDSDWVTSQIQSIPVATSQVDSDWVTSQIQSLAVNESAMTFYVDPNGSDSDSRTGNSIVQPLQSITNALTKVSQGKSIALMNGRYQEDVIITSASNQRNIVITGLTGSHSSGAITTIDKFDTYSQTGLKLSNVKVNDDSTFDNTDGSPAATNIGNHYNDVAFEGTTTFLGDSFHEARNCKFINLVTGGTGAKYFYNNEIEGTSTFANGAGSLVFLQGMTAGVITATGAGSVFVMKDVTSGLAGAVITIGPGVIYQLNNLTGFTFNIDPSAVKTELFLQGQGLPLEIAEDASTTYFEQIKIGGLKEAAPVSTKILSVDSDNNIRWSSLGNLDAHGWDNQGVQTKVLTKNRYFKEETNGFKNPTGARIIDLDLNPAITLFYGDLSGLTSIDYICQNPEVDEMITATAIVRNLAGSGSVSPTITFNGESVVWEGGTPSFDGATPDGTIKLIEFQAFYLGVSDWLVLGSVRDFS